VRAVSGTYCGDHIQNGNEQCDDGTGNVDPKNTAAITALPAGATYCTTSCTKETTPKCGDFSIDKNKSEQCDLGPANGKTGNGDAGSGCSASCQCTTDTFVSDASTVTSSVQAMTNPTPATVEINYWGWPATIPGSSWIWNFAERLSGMDPSLVPSTWASADNIQYFSRTFTLTHPSSNAVLSATADNFIDDITVDGKSVIANAKPSSTIANFSQVYTVDITQYLSTTALTHTVGFKVRNQANGTAAAGGWFGNPAALIFNIVSNPDCSS
jgi:hypothetical protein